MKIEEPLYLIKWRSKPEDEWQYSWLSAYEASQMYDNGQLDVEFGEWVIEPNSVPREMTRDDKVKISNLSDDISASK